MPRIPLGDSGIRGAVFREIGAAASGVWGFSHIAAAFQNHNIIIYANQKM